MTDAKRLPVITDKIVSLRASSLPLAFLCAGSIRGVSVPYNETSEPARNGSAGHKCFEGLIKNDAIDWDSVDSICDDFSADSQEVRYLCSQAQRIWPKVKQYFPNAMPEIGVEIDVAVPGLVATGTADIVTISGYQVRGADWKTGWKDGNYANQVRGYLAAILLAHPQLTGGTFTVIWVREQQIENYTMTQDDARRWRQRLVDEVVNWDGIYHPGDHCQYCKRHIECSAANALARSYVATMAGINLGDVAGMVALMHPQQLHAVYAQANFVGKVCEKALAAIKTRVADEGPFEWDGKIVELSEESRRKCDTERAWPILQEVLTDSELADCTTVSLSKVDKIVGQNAGRGNGAKAKEALRKKLELADAVHEKPFTKLVERRS